MEPWAILLIVVGAAIVLGTIAQRFGWIDLSNKQRNTGGGSAGVLGIGDEVFHPARYEAQLEQDRQTTLPAPAPLPGDGDLGIYEGQVRIDLTQAGRHRADGPGL